MYTCAGYKCCRVAKGENEGESGMFAVYVCMHVCVLHTNAVELQKEKMKENQVGLQNTCVCVRLYVHTYIRLH